MSDGINTENHTDESQKSEFRDKLKEAGRLVPAKSTAKPKGTFIPIETEGKLLSEIVIDIRNRAIN